MKKTKKRRRQAISLNTRIHSLKDLCKCIKRAWYYGIRISWILVMVFATYLSLKPEVPNVEAQGEPTITTITEDFESADMPAYTDAFDQYFGDKADEARKVAKCESGMNPKAQNKKTDDRGIMQINMKTWRPVFGDVDYYDLDTNVRLAKIIYDRSGSWSPWSSSIKCHKLR